MATILVENVAFTSIKKGTTSMLLFAKVMYFFDNTKEIGIYLIF